MNRNTKIELIVYMCIFGFFTVASIVCLGFADSTVPKWMQFALGLNILINAGGFLLMFIVYTDSNG